MFNKVYLVGVGLITGSLAKDLKRRKLAGMVIGIGRDAQRLSKAQAAGIIDGYELLQESDVSDANLVVLGVPVGKSVDSFALLKSSLRSDTLLTDVGSTKCDVIHAAESVFVELPSKFVPGHPIAGSEQSGFEHAQEHLFHGRKVILTPTCKTDVAAVQSIRSMWQAVGASVDEMSAEHHDKILSATSHLPHVLAYTLVNYLGSRLDANSISSYSAGGLDDFTRIASSSPVMWADICAANRQEILESITAFEDHLNELRLAIDIRDKDTIIRLFRQAKRMRDMKLSGCGDK